MVVEEVVIFVCGDELVVYGVGCIEWVVDVGFCVIVVLVVDVCGCMCGKLVLWVFVYEVDGCGWIVGVV